MSLRTNPLGGNKTTQTSQSQQPIILHYTVHINVVTFTSVLFANCLKTNHIKQCSKNIANM